MGVSAVVCVGERTEAREADKWRDVLAAELAVIKESTTDWSRIILTYDPLWVLHLDKEDWPKPEVVEEAHKFIREWLLKNVGD